MLRFPFPQARVACLGLILSPVLVLLNSPGAALAQIASPSNAGGNSGNNTSGSSSSPISTPTFSPSQTIPSLPSLSVAADGTITAAPAVQQAVLTAVLSAVTTPEASLISGVVSGNAAALSSTDLTGASQPADVVLSNAGAASTLTISGLIAQIAADFAANTLSNVFTVSAASTSSSGTVTLSDTTITVAVAGAEITAPATAASRLDLAQFAALAIVTGLSPQSITQGFDLVSTGATPIRVAQLMVSLQGLASATTLTSLSNGINAFNAIVQEASAATLQVLSTNATFQATRSIFLAASTAIT